MANASIVLTLPQPSLPEHENSLLGALLLFPEKLREVEDLYPSDFYGERTRILFQAMIDLDADGEPIDHLSLKDRIGEEVWERIGGYAWLCALDLDMPDVGNLQVWSRAIKIASAARAAACVALDLARQVGGKGSLADALGLAAERLEVLRDGLPGAIRTWSSLGHSPSEDELLAPYTPEQLAFQVKTGLPTVDAAGLMGPSTLNLIVARTGVGKTALALQIAAHNAITRRLPGGYISLEMPKKRLIQRIIAARALVDYTQIHTHRLSDYERADCSRAYREIQGAPLFFDDRPALTAGQIGLAIRRLKIEHRDAAWFVVDYLSLIELERQDARRPDLPLAKIAEGLASLARQLNVHITLLCQLSRRGEQENREPILTDISDSDGLAKPANSVLAVHRGYRQDEPGVRDDIGYVTTLKHRDGPQPRVKIRFLGAFQTFREETGDR